MNIMVLFLLVLYKTWKTIRRCAFGKIRPIATLSVKSGIRGAGYWNHNSSNAQKPVAWSWITNCASTRGERVNWVGSLEERLSDSYLSPMFTLKTVLHTFGEQFSKNSGPFVAAGRPPTHADPAGTEYRVTQLSIQMYFGSFWHSRGAVRKSATSSKRPTRNQPSCPARDKVHFFCSILSVRWMACTKMGNK